MLILGIDPGIAACGYGIIQAKGNKLTCLACGVLKTDSGMVTTDRLQYIYQGINDLINEFNPDQVAVESLFFARNTKTAMQVGQAKGVIMLACAHKDLHITEYTPLQVKQGVCGYGSASKEQVQRMVTRILHLSKTPKPDDATDALAVSLCHSQAYKLKSLM